MKEKQYRKIKEPINSKLTVVQDKEYKWGAIDSDGNIVVPFGKYAWIDGFQNGLAKVIGHNDTTSPNIVATFDDDWNVIPKTNRIAEQGIINEAGEEVLPLKFRVWKFYEKDFASIKYFEGNVAHKVRFESLNPNLVDESANDCFYDRDNSNNFGSDYGGNYGEYAGTYAQDVAGYSDDVIGDAFDGDPEAYWNID